jgi:hypothetical protein
MLEWKAQKSIVAGKPESRQRMMESPSVRMYIGHYEKKVQRSASEEKRRLQRAQPDAVEEAQQKTPQGAVSGPTVQLQPSTVPSGIMEAGNPAPPTTSGVPPRPPSGRGMSFKAVGSRHAGTATD